MPEKPNLIAPGQSLKVNHILEQMKVTVAKLAGLVFDLDRANDESLVLPEDEAKYAMQLVGNITFAMEKTVADWQKAADEANKKEEE